jgi:2-polyprenyl-6-methoxyphenol hydroxylase-like FAD-dependent oxidoreductase
LSNQLRERFGVTVELETELLSFEQSDDSVTVRLRKGTAGKTEPVEETVTVKYLVGNDGGRSLVRKSLGLSFLGETRPEPIIYGDAVIRGLDKNVSNRHSGVAADTDAGVSTCTHGVT